MRFTDGMEFDTSQAPATAIEKWDGWYCVGKGFLIPCDSAAEAQQFADELNEKKS